MNPKIIIVGQGISGTFLSWFLFQAGVDFVVIDDQQFNSSSRVAAGLINPVTGRRVVTVWLDDIILPFAEKAYAEIGEFLNIKAFSKKKIIDFFPNPFMKESFLKKLNLDVKYIQMIDDPGYLNDYFNYEFGSGSINPGYVIHLSELLPTWKKFLEKQNRFIASSFDFSKLHLNGDKVHYEDVQADMIIFCDGARSSENPYFSLLPFALHKGEAIIIEAPTLPDNHIYKKSMILAPMADKGYFWAGTNYIWDYEDQEPTENFRKSTIENLDSWLKVPYKIVEHRSAIRPATVERRPFVGFHSLYKNIGLLNGMGTKGCSLGPYFAHSLCENIINGTPVIKEASIDRFSNIMKRQG